MSAALRVDNLHYRYPDGQVALSGLSLEVAEGETLGLVGPNGAGKSTFLLHLNGLLRGQGALEVCGLPLTGKNLQQIRRLVGLVFEDPHDQLFMPTVFDDVAFGVLNLGLGAAETRERVERALEAVRISDLGERAPHRLSLGQRKRAALATVLALDCEILALDDPTGGLDPAGREEFLRLLAGLPQTKLIATHDLEMVRSLCSRAALMDGGRIVAVGPAYELLSDRALLSAHRLA
jgi:cobalt/nickel transport system ATP-binding protein